MLTYEWTPRPPPRLLPITLFANPMADTFLQDTQAHFDAAKDYIAMVQLKLIEHMRRRRAPIT